MVLIYYLRSPDLPAAPSLPLPARVHSLFCISSLFLLQALAFIYILYLALLTSLPSPDRSPNPLSLVYRKNNGFTRCIYTRYISNFIHLHFEKLCIIYRINFLNKRPGALIFLNAPWIFLPRQPILCHVSHMTERDSSGVAHRRQSPHGLPVRRDVQNLVCLTSILIRLKSIPYVTPLFIALSSAALCILPTSTFHSLLRFSDFLALPLYNV